MKHRVSYILLVPMTLWAMFFMIPELGQVLSVSDSPFADIRQWISVFHHGIPLLIWIAFLIYHGMCSVQIMIEDYVTKPILRVLCIVFLKIISFGAIGITFFAFLQLWIHR